MRRGALFTARPWAVMLAGGLLLALLLPWLVREARPQGRRQVKVVVEFQQSGREHRQGVEGGGGIIIQERRGDPRVRGRGGVGVEDTTTRVTRSTGVFTVVQDGAAGTMLVAQEVPYPQLTYYYNYALGRGHVAPGVAWQRVGTSLTVEPTVLADGQIRVRLTPRLSWFTPGGAGAIELVEAATELVVPSGRRVQLGGATASLHAVTRQILGYRSVERSGETGLALTATVLP